MGAPPGGTPLDIAAIIDRVLNRNINFSFRAIADGATVLTVLDTMVTVDCALGNATVELPSAVVAKKGMGIWLMRIDAALSNTLTISAPGGQTINGAASASIALQYSSLYAVSDGVNWLLFASPTAYALANDVLWVFPGTLSTDQNANLYTLVAKRTLGFVAFDVELNVAPTGADLIIDWLVNGIAEPTAQVTVPAGSTYAQAVAAIALASGDTIQPVVTQVGAVTPGMTMVMRARGI